MKRIRALIIGVLAFTLLAGLCSLPPAMGRRPPWAGGPKTTTTAASTTTTTRATTTTAASSTTTAAVTTTVPAPAGACATGWYLAEGQSWWWQPSFGGDRDSNSRHIHVGGCIPRKDTVLTGTVPFDVVVKMHNSPATARVYYVAVVVKTSSMEQSISVDPGWSCPTVDCTFTRHFDIPVSLFDKSGLEEFRFRASSRQPDLGTEIRASINFQTRINNGKTVDNVTRYPWLRGKGWYTDSLYCESGYRDDLSPTPSGPVSGIWSPVLRQVDHDAGDAPVTRHTARMNPDIHHGNPGAFLFDGPGQREGAVSINTGLLPSGPNKLMIHTECETSKGVNSGVLVVPVDVTR